ncbi:hypothetical protein EDC01DRAFT_782789 [Geopyxis carbonaria]|nr:hypothetical protein EDC01DRAFT_782789 [Geopyxis carbonaria]
MRVSLHESRPAFGPPVIPHPTTTVSVSTSRSNTHLTPNRGPGASPHAGTPPCSLPQPYIFPRARVPHGHPAPWTRYWRRELAAHLRNPTAATVVVEHDGAVVAFACWQVYGCGYSNDLGEEDADADEDEGEDEDGNGNEGRDLAAEAAMDAAVAENQRALGRGFGGVALRWGMERARELCVPVGLYSSVAGGPFYRRYGFRKVGELGFGGEGGRGVVRGCRRVAARWRGIGGRMAGDWREGGEGGLGCEQDLGIGYYWVSSSLSSRRLHPVLLSPSSPFSSAAARPPTLCAFPASPPSLLPCPRLRTSPSKRQHPHLPQHRDALSKRQALQERFELCEFGGHF